MNAKNSLIKQNKDNNANDQLIARRVYIYSLSREGFSYKQISLKVNLSRKTVEREMKWCKKNLPILDVQISTDQIQPANKKIFKRNLTIYMRYCEGKRYDELAERFGLSKRTICKIITWCRENIPNDFCDNALDDVIFDTVRRRAIVWSKFREYSAPHKSANQLAAASKHILELDNKILEWRGVIKNKTKDALTSDDADINDLIKALDQHLKNMTEEELREIIKKCS